MNWKTEVTKFYRLSCVNVLLLLLMMVLLLLLLLVMLMVKMLLLLLLRDLNLRLDNLDVPLHRFKRRQWVTLKHDVLICINIIVGTVYCITCGQTLHC